MINRPGRENCCTTKQQQQKPTKYTKKKPNLLTSKYCQRLKKNNEVLEWLFQWIICNKSMNCSILQLVLPLQIHSVCNSFQDDTRERRKVIFASFLWIQLKLTPEIEKLLNWPLKVSLPASTYTPTHQHPAPHLRSPAWCLYNKYYF